MSDGSNDDEVGYGKPPKGSRFEKGKSGNPKGRPKGAKDVQASLKRELESKITVQDGNRKVRISKAEAMARQLMNTALKGDIRAMMALLKLDPELYGSAVSQLEGNAELAPKALEPFEREILRDYLLGPPTDETDINNEPEQPNSDEEEQGDDDN
jgi:hypothetical protein